MAFAALGDELSCSICLNLYNEPVSLRCGHTYCRECIVTALDTQEVSGVYSCPECREEYTERPIVERNRKLSNIVDSFHYTQPLQESTKIFCTYCLDVPVPAAKTCLHCETSLCQKHLIAHNKSGDHILTKSTSSFGDLKCPVHKEILKYYCTKDNDCICMSCWVTGDHVGHKMEPLSVAYEKKKVETNQAIAKLIHDREEIQRRTQNLKKHRTQEKRKADEISGKVAEFFKDIRTHLDDLEMRVLTEISRQEEHISQTILNLIKELNKQTDSLSKAIDEIRDASVTTDQVTFLRMKGKNYNVISGDVISDVRHVGCLKEVVISPMLQKGLLKLTNSFMELMKKRQLPLIDRSSILLDKNTANNHVFISPDLRSSTFTETSQKKFPLPERFKSPQVLSKNSFSSGKYFWEVDVCGEGGWIVGVATPNIERKVGELKGFIGYNNKSWGIKFAGKLVASHNNLHKAIDCESPVQTLGVFLDYEAGRLSFYKLCDPIRHLHTFTTTFNEPLHAAFTLGKNISFRMLT